MRAAAIAGGIALAITGFLFVQYSIERGWISPERRVIIGAIAGIVCLVVGFPLHARNYKALASSITGAGAVLLYAASWAAFTQYGMIDFFEAFGAMVAVTAVCCWLAYRQASQIVAVLGLAGGFATPIVLQSGQDRPITLFGYLLLLDLAFLFVAAKRRWPSIGLVALGGTFAIQALWIFTRMERAGLVFGLVMLGVFALMFAGFIAFFASSERRRWIAGQAGALFLPFVFAIYFAEEVDLGADFLPLAALAGLLAVAAGWMARKQGAPWLPVGTSAGSAAIAFVWTMSNRHVLDVERAWELVGSLLALAAIHQALFEIAAKKDERSSEVRTGAQLAAAASSIQFLFVLVYAAMRPAEIAPWPWLVGFCALALLTHRQCALGAPPLLALAGTSLAGIGVFAWTVEAEGRAVFPDLRVWFAALFVAGGLLLLAARSRRDAGRRLAWWSFAGWVLPIAVTLGHLDGAWPRNVILFAGFALALGIQTALAASAIGSTALFVIAVVLACVVQSDIALRGQAWIARGEDAIAVLGILAAGAAVMGLWPLARPSVWRDRASAWRIAALTPALWFPAVHAIHSVRFGTSVDYREPLALGLVALLGALRLRALRADEGAAQRTGRIWFTSVALFMACFALPLQVDKSDLAITFALFAAALSALFTRIDSRGLVWTASIAMVLATVELVCEPLWQSYARSEVRVWNELAYLYLLPAACAIAAGVLLGKKSGVPAIPRNAISVCAIVLVFVWMNLEIVNAYAESERFRWTIERSPARDLTISVAWGVYALVLLVLGVSRKKSGLRWTSLALIVLTIGKVFLLDLGQLEGLFRAASMLGLALSLLLVSWLYQRFVFRRPSAAT